ncbi:MAG: Lrp/AsnC family transcriptional regulator [Candidatus Nitrosopolaris sp.]
MSNSRTTKIPVTRFNNNNDLNHSDVKGLFKLVDNTNLKIIEELVKNPSTSSASLATKLEMPLSSLQRRRSKLEKSVLIKSYHINLKASGCKMGDAVIKVDKGKSREVAGHILKKFKSNVMDVSTRINSEHNVAAQIIYNDTVELHDLLENIKSIPYVISLQWSEIVEIIGDNSPSVITAFFDKWADNA